MNIEFTEMQKRGIIIWTTLLLFCLCYYIIEGKTLYGVLIPLFALIGTLLAGISLSRKVTKLANK